MNVDIFREPPLKYLQCAATKYAHLQAWGGFEELGITVLRNYEYQNKGKQTILYIVSEVLEAQTKGNIALGCLQEANKPTSSAATLNIATPAQDSEYIEDYPRNDIEDAGHPVMSVSTPILQTQTIPNQAKRRLDAM
jgi:hypothetical protein